MLTRVTQTHVQRDVRVCKHTPAICGKQWELRRLISRISNKLEVVRPAPYKIPFMKYHPACSQTQSTT